MSISTLLFLLVFVAMMAMHLRGGGHAGHGGGHGGCGGGHSHGHDDAHTHHPSAPEAGTPAPQDPPQPGGAAGSNDEHSGHRHAR